MGEPPCFKNHHCEAVPPFVRNRPTEDQARLLEEFKKTYLKTSNRFTFLEFVASSTFAKKKCPSINNGQKLNFKIYSASSQKKWLTSNEP